MRRRVVRTRSIPRCSRGLLEDVGLAQGGSAGEFGGAECDVEVVQSMTGEAHEDQARSLQPVRHGQAADVQRAQPETGDELRHARLGLRIVAGHEHIQCPTLLQERPKTVLKAFTTRAPAGAALATSWAIEVSAGRASPSASALKGLLMSTMTLSANAFPYWVTTGTTSAYLRATITISPAGAAPNSPVVVLPPRVVARSAALD